jgi:hypothetical protein
VRTLQREIHARFHLQEIPEAIRHTRIAVQVHEAPQAWVGLHPVLISFPLLDLARTRILITKLVATHVLATRVLILNLILNIDILFLGLVLLIQKDE